MFRRYKLHLMFSSAIQHLTCEPVSSNKCTFIALCFLIIHSTVFPREFLASVISTMTLTLLHPSRKMAVTLVLQKLPIPCPFTIKIPVILHVTLLMVEFQIYNDASKELMYNKLIQVHAHNRCLYEYECPYKICNICGINIILQLPSALPTNIPHSTTNNRTFRTLSLTVDRFVTTMDCYYYRCQHLTRRTGMGVTNQISSALLFFQFRSLSKHTLTVKYRVYLYVKYECNSRNLAYFCNIENFAYG